jgi:hypothetical protein
VTRIRIIGALVAAAAVVLLCLPASALAGSYTWNLASDFTSSPPGANPDRDHYGATPWSYAESATAPVLSTRSHDPGTFQRLKTFTTGIQGGLAGWTGSDSTSPTVVGINPQGSDISNGTVTFPAHQIAVVPSSSRFAAIGWTSPLKHSASLLISESVSDDNHSSCLGGGATWTLDQNGQTIASGTATGQSILASPTVAPGGSIYLTVDPGPGLLYSAACVSTGVSLQIQAFENTPPTVTLATPAPGALISGGQPTFSGAATNGFGASPDVTVRVYNGSTATGTPLETVTTNRSGAAYAVLPSPALDDGTYTVQAQQDDLASPPNHGLSDPVTFTLRNAGPSIKIDSPGSGPLNTATPTLTGLAGTAPGDSNIVAVGVFAGSQPTGAPLRSLTATVSNGHFSVKVDPALPDGVYTAIAGQRNSAGILGTSAPQIFRIDTHSPAVTLDQPAEGAQVTATTPLFSGSAGTAFGDSTTVAVDVYAGGSTSGRRVAHMFTTANGSFWSVRVPFTLSAGRYTAVATQSDDAGHTGRSVPHTFTIAQAPGVIGPSVDLDRNDTVSIAISCRQPSTQTCGGTVLILTANSYQAFAGGPSGHLRVLFAYVSIQGGQTVVVQRGLPGAVASVLRRHLPVQVSVEASLADLAGHSTDVTARRALRRR